MYKIPSPCCIAIREKASKNVQTNKMEQYNIAAMSQI